MKFLLHNNQLHFSALCSCISSSPGTIGNIARQYSDAVSQLIASGRYDDKNDFTVVFQPFLRDNDLPRFVSFKSLSFVGFFMY